MHIVSTVEIRLIGGMMMKPEEASQAIRDSYIPKMFTALEEALEVAIQALEKQIPKKPERLNAFKAIGKCGGCERVISTRTASVYCQYCGNKVDWGNEDEV